MEQNTVILIEKLAATIGTTADNIVQQYVRWYIVSSIIWTFAGVAIIYAGWKVKGNKYGNLGYSDFPAAILRWIVIGIGLLFVCANLPDLLAPQGIAIHKLIQDLRGQ